MRKKYILELSSSTFLTSYCGGVCGISVSFDTFSLSASMSSNRDIGLAKVY